MIRTFRYIRLHQMHDALALGYVPSRALQGTPHGHYAVLCEFLCCCGRSPPQIVDRSHENADKD
jgi:hypothetical protein